MSFVAKTYPTRDLWVVPNKLLISGGKPRSWLVTTRRVKLSYQAASAVFRLDALRSRTKVKGLYSSTALI